MRGPVDIVSDPASGTRGRLRRSAQPDLVVVLATALAGASVLVALTGCGQPQERRESNPVGVNGQTGSILLRAVRIPGPGGPATGDDAEVWLTLINQGTGADVLTAVSSPAAETTEIRWDGNCDGDPQAVRSLRLPAAGAPPDPSPGPTAQPPGAPPFDAYSLRLVDLSRDVLAGTSIEITFTLAQAPPVTLTVPVRPREAQNDPDSTCIRSPAPTR